MSIVQSIEDRGPWTKELVIEVPTDVVSAEVSKIVNEMRRQVRMPGFRAGKTPASLVKSRFRADIEQELIERLVPRYWQEARSEKDLDALIPPRVENVEFKDGEPLTFKAIVEVRPEFDLDGSREFDLPSKEVLAGEDEVDEVIERIQSDLATFDSVERASSRGDRVKLKIRETPADEEDVVSDAAEDESAELASQWQEIAVEIGDPRVWEELSLAATGLEVGGKSDFTHQAPPAAAEEGEAAPAIPPVRHFQVEVIEVAEKKLAEADDELAKKVSDFETFAALREDVEKRIFEDKKNKRQQERETKLLQQLSERNPLDLPEGVVAQEVQSMLRDYAERLSRSGIDIEKAGLDWQKLSDEMGPQARQRVHAQLLLDAVAKADEIEVPEDQLSAVVAQIARARGRSLGEVQDELTRNGGLETVRGDLRRQRALRHLLGEPLDPEPEPDHDHHDHEHGHHHHHDHVHGEDCDHDH